MNIFIIVIISLISIVLLFLGFKTNMKGLCIVAMVMFLMLGGAVADSGVTHVSGTNSSLSEDNRSIIHANTKSQIFYNHQNEISILFFILALMSLFITFMG